MMDYIRKLPLLLALAAAIIIGLVGHIKQAPNKDNMFNMVVAMAIFYIAGLFTRNTIIGIMESNKRKAEEREKEAKRIEEEKKREELNEKMAARSNSGQNVDLVADDTMDLNTVEEEFDALPVADFIKSELNK
jgi:divalent metal cation (Fe/Co/Zn/Cd) transporter